MAFTFRPATAGVVTVALLSMVEAGLASSALAQSSASPQPAPIAVAALPTPTNSVLLETGLETQSASFGSARMSSSQVPTQPSAKDSWTIALVQTALAEKGCRDVAISGSWDRPTEVATLTALALPQRPERLTLDDNLVRLVRSAPATICPPWTWGVELGPQQRERRLTRTPQVDQRSAAAQGRKAPASKPVQPAARQARATSAAPRVTTAVKVARSNVSVARMTVNVPVF